MSFCLDDGAALLFGPASMDEPETAILTTHNISSEQATGSKPWRRSTSDPIEGARDVTLMAV